MTTVIESRGIRYRPALGTKDEDDAIAQVEALTSQGEAGYTRVQTGQVQLRQIQPHHLCVVAEETVTGKIVGARRSFMSAVLYHGKRLVSCYHEYVFVHPTYHRRGISSGLTKALEYFAPIADQGLSWFTVDGADEVALRNMNCYLRENPEYHRLCTQYWADLPEEPLALAETNVSTTEAVSVVRLHVQDALTLLQKHFLELVPVDLYLIVTHPLCLGVYKATNADSGRSEDHAILIAWDSGRFGNWHTATDKPQHTATLINLACTPTARGLSLLQTLIVRVHIDLTTAGHDAFGIITLNAHPIKEFIQSVAVGEGYEQVWLRPQPAAAAGRFSETDTRQESACLDLFFDPRCMSY